MTIAPSRNWYGGWLLVLVGLEAASWISFRTDTSWLLVGILLTVIVVGWRRPAIVAYASIAEALVGGKGYLLQLSIGQTAISGRMVLFTIAIIMSLRYLVPWWAEIRTKFSNTTLLLLVTWLVLSTVMGFVNHHQYSLIYTDANAFLFLLLLPAWWILLRHDQHWQSRVLGIAFAAVTIIGLKAWLVMLLFGENVHRLRDLYLWIRTTGIGEVTYMNHNAYRVFFQSHIVSLVVMLWLLTARSARQWQRWWWAPLLTSGLGVYLSLSRSLWLGGTVALSALILWLIFTRRWRHIVRLWVIVPVGIFAWAMMVWALSWPGFTLTGTNPVGTRFQADDAVNAATARQNQFRPLINAISRHPVIGSGFGQTVTYFSTDPSYQGWRTTTAFELGYLDLWLKIGITGIALFGWWVFRLWRGLRISPAAAAWRVSVLGLLVVHLTTPYLNHPLGLTWLMIIWLVAYAD